MQVPDASVELSRLERRLQREREARRAAEAIAEKGLRDLYEGQQQLTLLKRLSTTANESVSTRQAMRVALREICGHTGWALGHVYTTRRTPGGVELASNGVWHGVTARYRDFHRLSEECRFGPGVGMPGRVLESGAPVWLSDLVADDNFPRLSTALACGLHAAFAFPILVGPEVAGVLEFFAETTREPDEVLLRTLAHAGDQLGRVVERSRGARRLQAKNAELTRLIGEADRQREAAEAANQAKSAFLAVTSHEIRTPLHAVLGLAEALKREAPTPRQHMLASGVLDAGAMLLRLLNAVLDMSKIEAGRMVLSPAPFELRRTAEAVDKVWRAKAEELGLRLELDLSGLPATCRMSSDEGKVEQTLINLISNAMKFSAPGDTVRVTVAARQEAGGWIARADVLDQGPGIPAEDRGRVLQPFEQTGAGRELGGAGLGLSICAGNVGLLGGVMGLDDAPGGGCHVWFEFPAEACEAPAAAEAGEPEGEPLGRPLRVLAAEDNAANRHVLQILLEPAGVALEFAENGEEAVAASRNAPFDLILMDVNMPVMDGVEALTAIRVLEGASTRTPIHMLTANVFDDDLARYARAGADGVLKKPIELHKLYELLGEAAGLAARRAALQARAG